MIPFQSNMMPRTPILLFYSGAKPQAVASRHACNIPPSLISSVTRRGQGAGVVSTCEEISAMPASCRFMSSCERAVQKAASGRPTYRPSESRYLIMHSSTMPLYTCGGLAPRLSHDSANRGHGLLVEAHRSQAEALKINTLIQRISVAEHQDICESSTRHA